MNDIINSLSQRDSFLKKLISEKTDALVQVPPGKLRTSKSRNHVHFYLRSEETGPNGKYLKAGEINLIRSLAQKEYDERILRAACREQNLLTPLRSFYADGMQAESQYLHLTESKRKLILPIEFPIDEYAEQWMEEAFEALPISEGIPTFSSERGELMRSKSEVIIANMLFKRGVPYRYECPLRLGRDIVYPDFTILSKSRRIIIYWEHLGLMDNDEYRDKNLLKITKYEMYGYYPGERLILSFESSRQPLNIKLIEKMIERYCL